MKTALSPYHRLWLWLLREILVICLWVLAAWALLATDRLGIPHALGFIVVSGVVISLSMRVVASILAAGFCRWLAAMGHGLGVLVASLRYARGRH